MIRALVLCILPTGSAISMNTPRVGLSQAAKAAQKYSSPNSTDVKTIDQAFGLIDSFLKGANMVIFFPNSF